MCRCWWSITWIIRRRIKEGGDPGVKATMVPPVRPVAMPPSLDPKIIGPADELVAKYFPGLPLVPQMLAAATDDVFLEAIGIPVSTLRTAKALY